MNKYSMTDIDRMDDHQSEPLLTDYIVVLMGYYDINRMRDNRYWMHMGKVLSRITGKPEEDTRTLAVDLPSQIVANHNREQAEAVANILRAEGCIVEIQRPHTWTNTENIKIDNKIQYEKQNLEKQSLSIILLVCLLLPLGYFIIKAIVNVKIDIILLCLILFLALLLFLLFISIHGYRKQCRIIDEIKQKKREDKK